MTFCRNHNDRGDLLSCCFPKQDTSISISQKQTFLVNRILSKEKDQWKQHKSHQKNFQREKISLSKHKRKRSEKKNSDKQMKVQDFDSVQKRKRDVEYLEYRNQKEEARNIHHESSQNELIISKFSHHLPRSPSYYFKTQFNKQNQRTRTKKCNRSQISQFFRNANPEIQHKQTLKNYGHNKSQQILSKYLKDTSKKQSIRPKKISMASRQNPYLEKKEEAEKNKISQKYSSKAISFQKIENSNSNLLINTNKIPTLLSVEQCSEIGGKKVEQSVVVIDFFHPSKRQI